jgi:hypothetical protein
VLSAGKGALYSAELRDAKLLREIGVERDLRTPSIDEEGDFLAAIYAHIDERQRIGLHELHTRACAVAMQFIGRLALEALQHRNVQCRILLTNQLVAAHVDALQRSRCLLEIVAAIKRLRQHDFWIGILRLQGLSLFPAISAHHRADSKATRFGPAGALPNSLSDFEQRFASKVCQLRQIYLPQRADWPNQFVIAWAALSVQL